MSIPHPAAALFQLTGRVAVVTGASSGLGQRAATVLAQAGAHVVGVARRVAMLEEWKDRINTSTTKEQCAEIVAADLMHRDAIPEIVHQISAPFGPPDIVVYAAGINTRQPADEVTWDRWDTTLHLNLSAPFFLTQALVPHMKQQQWGRIVNFASLQTTRAFPGGIAYGTTKAGIVQMTRAMAAEWGQHGITANAIGPGFFPTELTQAVFDDSERAARNAAQTCLGRNGELTDIDGPLLFLCSDASAYVTGQTLMVDGGFTAK
jgi:NAD(P)-dependent dehydrogenase (short-subunit alcohol dehydrogenase family)